MSRIILFLEDDWEIRGNGLGNVAHLQYLPSLFLMQAAEKFDIKINFMVEVLQQLAFRKYAEKDRNIKIQADIWDENVRLMREKGHDIQLHLHPQWYHADFNNGFFKVSNNWNIASYGVAERRHMIDIGIRYLNNLLMPIDPLYKVIAFKAGSWALQPSPGILEDLAGNGIKIVLGVGKGIKYSSKEFQIDYTEMEEDTLPYHPDFSDIRKVSSKQESLIIIPIPFYTQGFGNLFVSIKNRFQHQRMPLCSFYQLDIPREIRELSPMFSGKKSMFQQIHRRFTPKSFEISIPQFEELKTGFDQILSRALRTEVETIPIIMQCHTKDFPNDFNRILKFFDYILEHYGKLINFMTFSEFLPKLNEIEIKRKAAE